MRNDSYAVEVSVVPETIRNISKVGAKRTMSTEEATAFLLIHGDQLQEVLMATVKAFVTHKLAPPLEEVTRVA